MCPEMWLKDCGEHHEHIAVHVDDALMSSKHTQVSVDTLMRNHHFNLKGAGPHPIIQDVILE